jgi:RHS repeat-associated protein
MMTNSTAQTIAWQAKYDPLGNPVTVTVSPVNNQRLPGQWFQIEDGLAYNWHRNYDPTLGRYSQADPLGFVDGPGVYEYAGGSPVMGVDPRGLMPSGRYSVPCGRCRLIFDNDNQKGRHTHWECPGQPKGCIKIDGTPCDGSSPPPENIKQCLRERRRVPADFMCVPEALPKPPMSFPFPKAPDPKESLGLMGALGAAAAAAYLWAM